LSCSVSNDNYRIPPKTINSEPLSNNNGRPGAAEPGRRAPRQGFFLNFRIRGISPDDFESIFEINQQSVPYVSDLDAGEFSLLLGLCEYSRVAVIDDEIAGYLFVLGEGLKYGGEEYNWFCQNLGEEFLYIDQVAIARKWQGAGCGTELYRDLENYAVRQQKNMLACEINYDPCNEGSMAFHRKSGFEELTRMEARGIIVSLQVKRDLREHA